MTFQEFNSLSDKEKTDFINKLKHEAIILNKRWVDISISMNTPINTLKYICKKFNIKKTKEQILKNRSEAYKVMSSEEKQLIKEKRKKTNLERYGVENPYQSEEKKKKIKQTCLDRYGDEIPCRTEEIKEKMKQNNLKNYGCEYTSQRSEIKEKRKKTNLERYGNACSLHGSNQRNTEKIFVDLYGYACPMKNENIKNKAKQTKLDKYGDAGYHNVEKMKQTNLERYGYECVFQNKNIYEKAKQSKYERYGDENYHNIEKMKQTKLERYGDSGYHNIEKMKQTNLERYGDEFAIQNANVKETLKQSFINKYGVDSIFKSDIIKNKIKQTKLKRYGDSYWNNREKMKKTKLERYGDSNYNNFDQVKQTNLDRYGFEYFCMTDKCRKIANANSKINQKFASLLEENNISFEQEFPLKNKSYDFKVGNYLIEIDPTYTHNSTTGATFINSSSKKEPTNKNYHLEKSKLAIENGYFCIHIFDWDDWNKVINLLLPKKTIYARNCDLKEVSKKACDEFLNLYHLQNTCNGQKVRYGLYYNNELIEVMIFGKPRYNKNYEWELLRLCSHKDYKIVGGSERLFKHFLKENNPQSIISYCDNSKFSGNIYKRLKMLLESKGSPYCVWSKNNEKITNNLLMQRGYDQLFNTNYGKGTSNRDLMIQNGWREVYDCGQSVYTWNK